MTKPTTNPNDVIKLAEKLLGELTIFSYKIELVGSIRRKIPPKDIDIIVIPKDKEGINNFMRKSGNIRIEGEKIISSVIENIQVDVIFATEDNWGAMLLTYTGSSGYNIGLRSIAKNKGFLLNQYGIYDRKTNELLASKTETEIYKILGKEYKEPELRNS